MIAYVSQATMASSPGMPFPGLYDVRTQDGQTFTDLTKPQVQSLAMRHGWKLQPVA